MNVLDQVRGVLGHVERTVQADGWDHDLTIWARAYLDEQYDMQEGAIVTLDNAAEHGVKAGEFFVPPGFIRAAPFPDTVQLWWDAVGQIMRDAKAYIHKELMESHACACRDIATV